MTLRCEGGGHFALFSLTRPQVRACLTVLRRHTLCLAVERYGLTTRTFRDLYLLRNIKGVKPDGFTYDDYAKGTEYGKSDH